MGPPPGEYYINWSYWDKDLKNSDVVKVERAKTSVEERYFLSAYKNLFSGVVTANDHFPHEWNEPFIPRLPMRRHQQLHPRARMLLLRSEVGGRDSR